MTSGREPLGDAEYERLAAVLGRSPRAMNVEMLEGFFAALVCCPDTVRPSEYLRVIWGGEPMGGDGGWTDEKGLQSLLDLMMHHWNSVADTLYSGDVFLPYIAEDGEGIARGNDWARGFLRGMELRPEDWAELFDDEEHGGLLVPILALANEHHADPEMRPYKEPMSAERRERLLIGMAAAVPRIYRYFASHRRARIRATQEVHTFRRPETKVGRNELCPCGSGKKYKKCCGAVTMH
jgi:uncharacterized protein